MPPLKLGIYRHHKGCLCRVFGIAKHHDTGELFVMYESLHKETDSQYWVRPIKEFTEEVEVDGKKVQRFTFESE